MQSYNVNNSLSVIDVYSQQSYRSQVYANNKNENVSMLLVS